MTISQELSSFFSPSHVETSPAPEIGAKAPSCPELPFPADNGKPTIISFLRHCGCPVTEAAFLKMRTASAQHPDINFITVSHSDQQSTEKWLNAVGGSGSGSGDGSSVTMVVDADRQIYAKWGLGIVSWGHLWNLAGLASIWKMGREDGIWQRPTESGNRWQSAGSWAVDAEGYVRWGRAAVRVDDMVDIDAAIGALRGI
ncbi:hypothetical protein N7481_000348 [Penicillium waksmanii]|uniref:uncharacterized protein n=1 Tax=Penicillium waksmanii TaxID=69791 RepID=UPI002548EFA1|nr:uncharacterized protein N7481_000348 [Penicillium waksmanii]KAJ5999939.1 hypothetical protein N7481_000348 [Penicillium waksmanii]